MDDPTDDDLQARRRQLRRSARPIHGGLNRPEHEELELVAAWCADNGIDNDSYGTGPHLQAFENRVAELLGYPAARFLPSGTMAQQIAARIWTQRIGRPLVGMHPTCHLELHEERGYRRLHGLDAVLVGRADRPMTASDLAEAAERPGVLIVELPTRENGGQLPTWDELVELCGAAREQGTATHLDGARLWEAAAGYQRPLGEICALFDSTYVSFYKGIGALPGSMLAGPEDVIAEAKVWQRRHGGNLMTSMANWVSADMRLDRQLAQMGRYTERAKELAAALSTVDGLLINPPIPQVNMFHVHIRGDEDELLAARDRVAETEGIWLFGSLASTDVPGISRFEVAVGDAAVAIDLDEVTRAFTALLQR